jgi:REP element-mobilizing transposase RayT
MSGSRRRTVIAHHLILHGYGHWLPNDPRGSGSAELREGKFAPLGDIHFGRRWVQPDPGVLRRFHRRAEPLLEYATFWFDDAKRQAAGDAVARVVDGRGYTVWACAVMSNHVHVCIRRHRDDALTMWHAIGDETREAVRNCVGAVADHPVWSERPYKVFLYSRDDVRRVVRYIASNPIKEGGAAQDWPFVKPYDGWPHHKSGRH